ncbi:hypothetical protein FKW77_000012 [Venturia effusa]|uniref:3'-5' exonuclease domain-containing protein n=1 Tax=Venturia effusa TaxID=50376 RepID=A0A517LA42_9PEZI|nr:hypothetical protein FKW77_000012 [Venturia effusa]
MASPSPPRTSPPKIYLWNPCQPIRFAPHGRDTGDRTWHAAIPAVFADNIGTANGNARSFSTTVSRHASGAGRAVGRRPRPSLAFNSRVALASKGESANDIAANKTQHQLRQAKLKKDEEAARKARQEEDRVRRKALEEEARAKQKALEEADRLRREAAEERRLLEERRAREAMQRAREADANRIQKCLLSLQQELDGIAESPKETKWPAVARKVLELPPTEGRCNQDCRVQQYKSDSRLENLHQLFEREENDVHEYQCNARAIRDQIHERELAELRQFQSQLPNLEEELVMIEQRSVDRAKFLQQWPTERSAELEQLFKKKERDHDFLELEAKKLTVDIADQWRKKLQRRQSRQKAKGRMKSWRSENIPTFFRQREVLDKVARLVRVVNESRRRNIAWQLVLDMLTHHRKLEAMRIEKAWKREEARRRDQARHIPDEVARNNQTWTRLKNLEREIEKRQHLRPTVDSLPGYIDYKANIKKHTDVLYEVKNELREFQIVRYRELESRENECVHHENGHRIAHVLRYEKLRIRWIYTTFDQAVELVSKWAHQARQKARIRMLSESSETAIRLLTRIRRGDHALLLPHYSASQAWSNVRAILESDTRWSPPPYHSIDPRQFRSLNDFRIAGLKYKRANFGTLLHDMENLAQLVTAQSRGWVQATIDQNVSERLEITQRASGSQANQLFYKRLRPCVRLHDQVVEDVNNILDAIADLHNEIGSFLASVERNDSRYMEGHASLSQWLIKNSAERRRVWCMLLSMLVHQSLSFWCGEVNEAINDLARHTYKKLHSPDHADFLAEAAPGLQSWFKNIIVEEREKAGKTHMPQLKRPIRTAQEIAQDYLRLMRNLLLIERNADHQGPLGHGAEKPGSDPGSEEVTQLDEAPGSKSFSCSFFGGKKAPEANGEDSQTSHLPAASTTMPQEKLARRVRRRTRPKTPPFPVDRRRSHLERPKRRPRPFKRYQALSDRPIQEVSSVAAVDTLKSEKTEIREDMRATSFPTHNSLKPSGIRHAPFPSLFSRDELSSEVPNEQVDSSSDHPSSETSDPELDSISAPGEDLSESESISEAGTTSDTESSSDTESASLSDADSDESREDETYTPLDFQIPADMMRKAMLASPGTPASFWSHKLYRGPADQKVTVHYCRSKDTSETVAKLFRGKSVLGFDIEWKPQANAASGLKSNVSLIQIACENRVGLFHIALHKGETPEEILPPTLREIILSRDVLKTGVAILSDFSRVAKYLDIQAQGIIELSHWHRLVTYSEHSPKLVNKKLVGLATQVQIHFQLPLSKGDVRTSDWSKQLNHEQCTYAAADAYASYRLYEILEEKRIAMRPRPPRPHFAELKMPIKLADRLVEESPRPEDLPDVVDEGETSSGGPKNPTLHSSHCSQAMDEDITDEELLLIESATGRQDVEDLTQENSDVVKYPDLPPFDDCIESSIAQLVGRVRLPNPTAPASSTAVEVQVPHKAMTPKATSPTRATEYPELLAAARAWADSQSQQDGLSCTQPHHRKGRKRSTWLTCYYLWHHEGLQLEDVAKTIRTPPLKEGTVATYIAEAVGYGGCETEDLERLRTVLNVVPMQAWGRFRFLRRRVEEGLKGDCDAEGKTKGKGKLVVGKKDANGDHWIV